MSENGPPDDGRTLPMSRYPDPAAGYTVEGGVPTVAATNRAFERVLGAVDPGVTLPDALDRFGVSTPDEDAELADLLVGADQRTVYLETDEGNYHARVLPPTDDDDGYVLFVDAAAVDDPGTGAGADGDSGADERPDAPETELGIDRVASVLSHDLRNPLDVAEARLRAGRERGEDEHFEHVAAAHDRMERIIEDVLTLSRGEEVVDPDDAVDLEAIAQSAWGTVETEGATLTVADALPTTVADRDRTERLFENLFRNAVEHGSTSPPSHAREDAVEHGSTSPSSRAQEDAVEHGSSSSRPSADDAVERGSTERPPDTREDATEGTDGPEVVVGQLEDPEEGFYVTDDGPGIPPDERGTVFEPGYTTHDHGTGLGLSIVERIAEAHDWEVAAVEADGGGARIEVRNVRTGVDG